MATATPQEIPAFREMMHLPGRLHDTIDTLVQASLFAGDESIRNRANAIVARRYSPIICGAFEADNQVYVNVWYHGSIQPALLGDVLPNIRAAGQRVAYCKNGND